MEPIYTTARQHLDYPDTVDHGWVAELSGGMPVRRVECSRRQQELYLAADELSANEDRWKKIIKTKRAYLGRRPQRYEAAP